MNVRIVVVSLIALGAISHLTSREVDAAEIAPAIAEFNALHHDKAKQMFSELVTDARHKDAANYYLGRIALAAAKYQEAREYLEASVAIEPNSADELYWLAMTCGAMLQQPSQSANMELYFCYMQGLEAAYSVTRTHVPTLIALHQFNATGQAAAGASTERAEELLVELAAVSKADADASRLVVLNRNKETDKAVALAQSMIAAYPDSVRALLEAGRTLSNNGKHAEAMTAFDKATAKTLTMDNRLSIQAAYLEIGHLSWRTKSNIEQGIAALTKMTDTTRFPININTNWAYVRLAELYGLKSDSAQHKKYLQLLESSPVEKGALILKEIELAASVR